MTIEILSKELREIVIKNIVGQAVSGENFFNRSKEIRKIRRAIESGSHILISAPRRVGKTSILFHIRDNLGENFYPVYIITESIESENDYFKRLFNEVIKSDFIGSGAKLSKSISNFVHTCINKVKGIEVGGIGGLEFAEGKDVDYRNEFINLIKSVYFEEDERILIMVDEFPQTVENIINKEGENKAVHFLQSNRVIRHEPELKDKIQFIYTGSIGLENIVSRLESMNLINDLNAVHINPLSKDDAAKLIHALLAYYRNLEHFSLSIENAQIEYLLNQIEWLIPFYIQLVIQEIYNVSVDEEYEEITNVVIDSAFKQMLGNRNHFEHWQTRLRKAFKKEEYKFAQGLLNLMAENMTITSSRIGHLAEEKGIEESYKTIVRALVYDGYINNNDDPTVYRFNSPVLRMWWFRNVTN